METKDSAYVSPTDVSRSPRWSQPPNPSPLGPELPETYAHLRFLVSNIEAGCVIGKGGTTISELQSESGARIQLSRGHELFPGTTDRIIMISGSFDEVLHAMDLILQKLSSEIDTEDGENADPKSTVRLIVPNSSCGGLIGKGGATIKSFMEQSGATIKISPQDNYYRLADRLVTVVGFQDERMRAIDLVLAKLVEDSHYSHYVNTPFSYAAAYGMNLGPSGLIGKFPNNKQEDQSNSVTIGISDTHIGLIVGRGGRNVMEISQMSGARIKISDRGDFMSGTTNRKVTISGSQSAIHTAEDMIMHKVNSVLQRVN